MASHPAPPGPLPASCYCEGLLEAMLQRAKCRRLGRARELEVDLLPSVASGFLQVLLCEVEAILIPEESERKSIELF